MVSKLKNQSRLILEKPNDSRPPTKSIHDFSFKLNNGKTFSFSDLKGKKILIVNTASACGFTKQYKELEELYRTKKDKLVVIGFPANNFMGQESGTDKEIASFCEVNFGVTFPLMQKSDVRGSATNPIYKWLSDPKENGWNTQKPNWNFAKYLINEEGQLIAFFDSAIKPTENVILEKI